MQRLTQFISRRYPTYGDRNVFWYYWIAIFGNTWFIYANWLFFVLMFVGTEQFAVFEAVAFAAGMLVEIPSGAIADLLGRKKTIIIGLALQTVAIAGFVLADIGVWWIFLVNFLSIVSYAIQSGAYEALLYDSMKESGTVEHFDDVVGKATSLELFSVFIAALLGGLAWSFSSYAPWLLSSAGFLIATIMAFKLREPSYEREMFSLSTFTKQTRRGFYYLFKAPFRVYTYSLTIMAGTFLLWEDGIVHILMGDEFGFNGESLSYVAGTAVFISFVLSYNFKSLRKKLGDTLGFGLLLSLAASAWILAIVAGNMLVLGAAVLMIIQITGSLSDIWLVVILNQHVHSADRATTLSTLSFLIHIPYIFVVILFASLAVEGNTKPFYFVIGVLLLLGLLSYVRAESKEIRPS